MLLTDWLNEFRGTKSQRRTAQPGLKLRPRTATQSRRAFFETLEDRRLLSGMVGLGDLAGGEFWSIATAVSADGAVIVGHSKSASSVAGSGSNNRTEVFRWTAETEMVGLVLQGNAISGVWQPNDVSADGSVIVGSDLDRSTSDYQAYRWTAETGIDHFAGYNILANGVSADGSVIVGSFIRASRSRLFRWTAETGTVELVTDPGLGGFDVTAVSADGSVIVGSYTSSNGLEAFRWTAKTGVVGLGDLDGGDFLSRGTDVSADGSVVVGRGVSANGNEAFRWTEETGMVGLGDLPGGWFRSSANGVSADGSVIVGRGVSAVQR